MYLILYYFIYVCIYVSIFAFDVNRIKKINHYQTYFITHTHKCVYTFSLNIYLSTKLNGYYFQTYFINNNFCTFFFELLN